MWPSDSIDDAIQVALFTVAWQLSSGAATPATRHQLLSSTAANHTVSNSVLLCPQSLVWSAGQARSELILCLFNLTIPAAAHRCHDLPEDTCCFSVACTCAEPYRRPKSQLSVIILLPRAPLNPIGQQGEHEHVLTVQGSSCSHVSLEMQLQRCPLSDCSLQRSNTLNGACPDVLHTLSVPAGIHLVCQARGRVYSEAVGDCTRNQRHASSSAAERNTAGAAGGQLKHLGGRGVLREGSGRLEAHTPIHLLACAGIAAAAAGVGDCKACRVTATAMRTVEVPQH